MVRNYSTAPVDPAAIERLVATARKAPSAGFSQGIHLVVVTDEGRRRMIAEIASEDEYARRGFDRWVSKAPVHIAVCVAEQEYHDRYNEQDKLEGGREIEWPVPYWWIDAGCVFMLLLLGAVDEGLSAGFFGVHRIAGLASALDLPVGVVPIGVVTVGHPEPDRPSSSLARGWRPLEEVVHRERW